MFIMQDKFDCLLFKYKQLYKYTNDETLLLGLSLYTV